MLKTVKVSFGPQLLSEKWQFADVLPTEMTLFYGNQQDFESPIFRRALLKHWLHHPVGTSWGPRSHGSYQGLILGEVMGKKPMEFPANQHLSPQVCC